MADSSRDLAAWLALCSLPGLKPAALERLLDRFGSAEAILVAPTAAVAEVAGAAAARAVRARPDPRSLNAALAWACGPARAILTLTDPRYPRRLREIGSPPPLLFAHGRTELLAGRSLAIVGSRNATVQGSRNAERFARALARAGLCVVSGLALGIDAAAHRGALDGGGSTIAVLGTGIDIAYPARHRELHESIAERGLLLSEFPLGTGPSARNFPRRNRIVSGLSEGCLVVEAALASGSLVTARLAADQGRDVFAVPGSIHSPLSRGCHHLIKQGAKLVESIDDVLEELGVTSVRPQRAQPASGLAGRDATTHALLAALGHDPCETDHLVERTGLTADAITAVLAELELDGLVEVLPGGRYQRSQ